MKPPYLILHKQSRILNTPNSVACVFDDSGSKCKMMYHFKISAEAGINLINYLPQRSPRTQRKIVQKTISYTIKLLPELQQYFIH